MTAETDGFTRFIEARGRALQRTAWLLTGDWALAEDLVQTALARAWPRWDRIRRTDEPELYVRQVMVNTWVTWTRRRWRGERSFAEVPDQTAPVDVAAEVAARAALSDALEALTARQRAVVVLRLFDDLSEAQVARVLDCATGTVKATLAQALAKLRSDPRLTGLTERRLR